MALTFLQAKQFLAQYAGKGGLCPDDPQVDLFVLEVLQQILFKGPSKSVRTYCFQAHQGCITIPYELETPLRVKIDNRAGGVWNQWFKFYDVGYDAECLPAAQAISEESNYYATIYDLPPGGSRVAIIGTCNEACDAHVIVKGVDLTGREIITVHKGEQVVGEYLTIKKGVYQTSSVTFGKITDIVKTKTNGYSQLYAVNVNNGNKHFLADYSPFEEIPQYRRFRLTTRCVDTAIVTVIGRIRLKAHYADSDVLPIENINLLRTAAQSIQQGDNNDMQTQLAKDARVDKLLSEEVAYKGVHAGQPLNIFHPTSPGTIKGIIQGGGAFRKWWGR